MRHCGSRVENLPERKVRKRKGRIKSMSLPAFLPQQNTIVKNDISEPAIIDDMTDSDVAIGVI